MAGGLAQIPAAVVRLFSGTAEHNGHLPAGVLRPDGAEQGLKGQAVVGVVHNGVEAAVGVGVGLHPSGHPGPDQAVVHGGGRDVEGVAHRDDAQGVFHIEQPGHG